MPSCLTAIENTNVVYFFLISGEGGASDDCEHRAVFRGHVGLRYFQIGLFVSKASSPARVFEQDYYPIGCEIFFFTVI